MLHEIAVFGIPVSLQGAPKSKEKWQEAVKSAARQIVAEEDKLDHVDLTIVILHFWFDDAEGDLDNIAKPILDAMNAIVYGDDRQVVQLTLRRTELGVSRLSLEDPSRPLAAALERASQERRDFVYIRVSDETLNHNRLP